MRSPYRKAYNSNIVEAVQLCGWNVLFLSSIYDSPFNVRIFNDDESHNLSIYGWGLTHGGGNRSKEEYRIQVHVEQFQLMPNFKTLVLGWWQDVEIFAGFDVRKHLGQLGYSPSIQVRRDALQKAALNGVATHSKENQEIVVTFRPDFFVDYVRNIEDLHNFGESTQDLEELETVIQKTTEDEDFQVNDKDIEQVSEKRKTVVQTVTRKVRQAGFQRRVLTAYNHQCAFCSIQLNLIDAAHIVPVAEADSTDYTSNGMALCALHHRAFDNALITINDQYETLVSQDKIKQLKVIRRDSGLENFIKNLRPMIALPPAITDRTHAVFIGKANELRGWRESKIIKVN